MSFRSFDSMRAAVQRSIFQRKRKSAPPLAQPELAFEMLEPRQLLTAVSLADFSASNGTGEKPQSKVWEHADQWWTVMPGNGGTWIWRLDGTSWTPSLRISGNTNVTADVKAAGNLTHVLLFDGAATQLATVEYAGAGAYAPWTMRPQLVNVPLAGAETATIDLDSTGRLWVAADNGSNVDVRYSDGLYNSWSNPITVAAGIGSDDISVVTALPNGTIGVLWSDQTDKRFGFRYHVDGTAPDQWSANEVPASGAALNIGGGMADDHLNVAVASDGTLYAAVKTSYDSGGQTKIGLIVRRPNGVWDNALYRVDTSGTRPIVLLNESAGRLIVAYAAREGSANIVYRESPLGAIAFGARQTLIGGSVQNVSSTKQNFTDEVVLIAGGGGSVKSVLFSFDTIEVNRPPTVDAGANRTITIGSPALLDGTVTDDGLPGPVMSLWALASGPGSVTFASAAAVDTTATFSAPGTYVLRLTANDGQLAAADEVTIIVQAAPPPDPDPTDVVTATFQDGVASYSGTRDAMIRALNSQTNYGGAAALEVDGSPDIASLIAWDLRSIPVGSTVLSATIDLYVTNSTSHSYDILALDRAWDELGVTWNMARAGMAWSASGASGAADRNGNRLGSLSARNTGFYRITLNAAGLAAVKRWIDNPADNHGLIFQNYNSATDGIDFLSRETSNVSQRPKLSIDYSPPGGTNPPTNAPPQVDAGANQTIAVGQTAALQGAISDDGLPGPVTSQWSKVSGPGAVSFGNPAAAVTSASFSTAGTYVLRLMASDGALSAQDDVTIVVQNAAPVNQPPQASAGPDRTVTLGSAASLDGTVSDDGLPGPMTTTWTKVSGPGAATFANAAAVGTSVSFSLPGTYVLRLSASDGQYTTQDDVTVTVNPPSTGDAALVGAWGLDSLSGGTAVDSSGNGRTATAVGSPQPTAGAVGGALSFNKSNYLLVNDADALDPGSQITIAAWIRPAASGTQYVVKKGRHDATDGYELSLSSSGAVFVRFNQASSGDSFRVNSSSKYPTDGSTWMHVAATYDGATIKLYVNGVLQASRAASFRIASNNLPLAIGAQDDGYRGFGGGIDDVRIYDRALTAEEIAALRATV